jgi:hypothetical protein
MFQGINSSLIYRIIAVSAKPAMLVIMTSLYDVKYAVYFSVYILLSHSLIHLFHSNLYRKFYEASFSGSQTSYVMLREFFRYIRILKSSLVYFGILVIGLLVFYLWVVAELDDLKWLFPLIVTCVFFDKVFDELIRYLNFSGKSNQTSLTVLFSGSYVGIVFLLIGVELAQWKLCLGLLVVLCTYFFYFRVFVLTRQQIFLILWSFQNTNLYSPTQFFKLYKSKIIYGQIAAVLQSNVVNLDRHVYSLVYPSVLPAITLLSQLGSVLVLYVDLFKIFNDRPHYVKRKKRMFTLGEDSDLLIIFCLYCFAALFVVDLLNIFDVVPEDTVINSFVFYLYMLIFPLIAMSRIGLEIIFWKAKDKILLYIQASFIFIFGAMLFLSFWYSTSWIAIVYTAFGFSLIKFIYLAYKAREDLVLSVKI